MQQSRASPKRGANSDQRRLTVHDAARQLGISEDAVRMRIKRGTLSADKEGGRLYVLLDTEPTTDRTDELIEELRGRVSSLEHQLGQEREANRENRRIIAALTSRSRP
jgi:Mg2+ and Co2+ transporter CorA